MPPLSNTNWELIKRSALEMIAVSTAGVKPTDSRCHINILASECFIDF